VGTREREEESKRKARKCEKEREEEDEREAGTDGGSMNFCHVSESRRSGA